MRSVLDSLIWLTFLGWIWISARILAGLLSLIPAHAKELTQLQNGVLYVRTKLRLLRHMNVLFVWQDVTERIWRDWIGWCGDLITLKGKQDDKTLPFVSSDSCLSWQPEGKLSIQSAALKWITYLSSKMSQVRVLDPLVTLLSPGLVVTSDLL